MTTLACIQRRHVTMVIVFICLQHYFVLALASFNVFFDNFGDCERREPFELADDDYRLKPLGGNFAHESLICDMTFKAPQDCGVCITFEEFKITDCSVKIKIFNTPTSSGSTWKNLDCSSPHQNQMCTPSRYVTVLVEKELLNSNKGYNFEIIVQKSNTITQEGVLFASIGVFVGVILAVVALTAVLAISILYCCCKHRHGIKKVAEDASQENGNLVQPSAPPVDIDDHPWAAGPPHMFTHYPTYSHGHPPPPYLPPPPYESENETSQGPAPSDDQEQTFPVKQ